MHRFPMLQEQRRQNAANDHAAEVARLVRDYVATKKQPGETFTEAVFRLAGNRDNPAILRKIVREGNHV